ncbi:MAG: hypothetical protein ACWA5Q_06305 [bacterium]
MNNLKQFAVVVGSLVIGGCASVQGTTDIGDITVRPGDSSLCLSNPCTVFFQMPEGSGKLTLIEDGPAGVWETGKFEAGSKAEIGEYWAGQTVFTIKEMPDSPKAWLTITGRRF